MTGLDGHNEEPCLRKRRNVHTHSHTHMCTQITHIHTQDDDRPQWSQRGALSEEEEEQDDRPTKITSIAIPLVVNAVVRCVVLMLRMCICICVCDGGANVVECCVLLLTM